MTWLADLLGNVRVALDGLVVNKLRSALTMLGVIIGVGAVIALLSIGAGAQASITEQISSVGTNLLIVMPGAFREGGVQHESGSAASLTYDDAKAIADASLVPDAKFVAPEYSRSTQIIFGDANINASVTGTTPEYQSAFDLEVARGRFIEAKDVDKRAAVVVLGYQAAQDLFGAFDPLGQKVKVALPGGNGGRVVLTVIGVLKEKGSSMMGSVDDAVFVPISTAQTRLFSGRNPRGDLMVTRVNVVAASERQTGAVEGQLEALLYLRHGLDPDEEADFGVMNQADLLSMANQVTGIMTVFLGAIAGISLLVGGIGIMNIMLVSVTERTREIGIRKAVGARKADILAQFLMEAVVLSLLGGLIGIL
ncbi:MAG TPA: ABC transporter permease, partial [Anaerolineae bacterium]|nr:ABC transporter permease [Anaerolineae bacterium]